MMKKILMKAGKTTFSELCAELYKILPLEINDVVNIEVREPEDDDDDEPFYIHDYIMKSNLDHDNHKTKRLFKYIEYIKTDKEPWLYENPKRAFITKKAIQKKEEFDLISELEIVANDIFDSTQRSMLHYLISFMDINNQSFTDFQN
jgi:hypothetical protein